MLDDEGIESEADTQEARADYRTVLDILAAAPTGYAPRDALRGAGFDAERWLRLLELTGRRDRPSGKPPRELI